MRDKSQPESYELRDGVGFDTLEYTSNKTCLQLMALRSKKCYFYYHKVILPFFFIALHKYCCFCILLKTGNIVVECNTAIVICFSSFFFLQSSRQLMPRMYCSHVAYCTTLDVQTLTTSRLPKRSWQSEVELNLIIFRRSNFHHQSSTQRSQQPKVELCGREMAYEFCLKYSTSTQHSGIFYMP